MNNFQNSVKNIQSNLLSYAFILTSNRVNAYSLLSKTTAAVLSHESSMPRNMELKDWAIEVMKAIYGAHYSKLPTNVTVKSETYKISVKAEVTSVEGLISEEEFSANFSNVDCGCSEAYSMYVTGYTVEEISVKLGISQSAVSSRVKQAMREMQQSAVERA